MAVSSQLPSLTDAHSLIHSHRCVLRCVGHCLSHCFACRWDENMRLEAHYTLSLVHSVVSRHYIESVAQFAIYGGLVHDQLESVRSADNPERLDQQLEPSESLDLLQSFQESDSPDLIQVSFRSVASALDTKWPFKTSTATQLYAAVVDERDRQGRPLLWCTDHRAEDAYKELSAISGDIGLVGQGIALMFDQLRLISQYVAEPLHPSKLSECDINTNFILQDEWDLIFGNVGDDELEYHKMSTVVDVYQNVKELADAYNHWNEKHRSKELRAPLVYLCALIVEHYDVDLFCNWFASCSMRWRAFKQLQGESAGFKVAFTCSTHTGIALVHEILLSRTNLSAQVFTEELLERTASFGDYDGVSVDTMMAQSFTSPVLS